MMKLLSRSLMLLCLLVLAACAQLRPVSMPVVEGQGEPTDFRLEGRLAVRADGKGYYANFDWLRRQGDDDIAILNPLGQILATLTRENGLVCLREKDRQRCADDTETLTRETLGWPLPLDNLGWWIAGQPAPGPWRPITGGFEQDGWSIKAEEPAETADGPRPRRVILTRGPQLEIRFALNAWQPAR